MKRFLLGQANFIKNKPGSFLPQKGTKYAKILQAFNFCAFCGFLWLIFLYVLDRFPRVPA